jgi:hypothetical protein
MNGARELGMRVCGKDIHIEGKILRIARLEGDACEFSDAPEAMLEGLRKCGRRIDLFTFLQKVTDTTPRFRHAMEWDNFAPLPGTTFENWGTQQIGFKARNKANRRKEGRRDA